MFVVSVAFGRVTPEFEDRLHRRCSAYGSSFLSSSKCFFGSVKLARQPLTSPRDGR